MHIVPRKTFPNTFSSNFEANASELLGTTKEMFPRSRCYMYSNVSSNSNTLLHNYYYYPRHKTYIH